jgi:thiol-disulfide isomerase/thioredoxin
VAVAALAAAVALAVPLLPRGSVPTILWWQGRAVRWAGGRGVVWSDAGELLKFDRRGRVTRLPVALAGRTVIEATGGPDGDIWLVDGGGTVVRRRPDAALEEIGRTPFDIPTLARAGDGLWAARSPVQFTFRPESAGATLAALLDDGLRAIGRADTILVPANPFFSQLANAGHLLAADDGGAIFAPFIRDEVARYDREGRVLWRARRGLAHQTPDPTMFVREGRVLVDYAPVNLGLALGPDRRLYVLSTPEATTATSRLDALDLETGRLLETRRFPTALPTIAVDSRGRLTTPNPDTLLSRAELAREALQSFDLPAVPEGRVRLEDFAGRVTMVNFWASWCAPCREEMPALDSLRRSYDSTRVALVALSDDVIERSARAFVTEMGFTFPIGLGGGRLKSQYHYVGLPHTVLLDARGRTIRQWSGYTGPDQIRAIGAFIDDELARSTRASATPAHDTTHRH